MSHLPKNFPSAADQADGLTSVARSRAQDALQTGRDYAQENPIPVVLGALLIGVFVGLLCVRREAKPKDAAHIARELVEDAFSQIADRLPGFRRREACPGALRAQCSNLGRKLRWW